MKQVIQDLNQGTIETWDVPDPVEQPGEVLIDTICSLISTGTEKSLTDFGKSNWIKRIKNNPDKVKMVLDKARKDGWSSTLSSVSAKLSEPMQLGYSNVGVVRKDTGDFKKGDRVVSNGKHASVVSVPHNLVHKIPDDVSDDEAVFTIVGAIGLQGVRLAKPKLGEIYVVYGLGLIGLLTVQLLAASGCKVIGVDLDEAKRDLCSRAGGVFLCAGDGVVDAISVYSEGYGVDGVIICASAPTNEIISNAAKVTRQRGKIVLVGVVGLNLNRSEFYEKELTFQVSCSYGPGRYDPTYEHGGVDYPFAFVRWTENRNFSAILELMSEGKLKVHDYVSAKFKVDDAVEAYKNLSQPGKIATLIDYENVKTLNKLEVTKLHESSSSSNRGNVGFIGAGGYAVSTLLPAFKKADANLHSICSSRGLSAINCAKRFKIHQAVSEVTDVISDKDVDALVISTRHNTHAELVQNALRNSKHLYIEKPLCLTTDELNEIRSIYSGLTEKPILTVGYNRRASPHIEFVKKHIRGTSQSKHYTYTVLAGKLEKDHWTLDPKIGGGRFIGEGCHFIDLICYLEQDFNPKLDLYPGEFRDNDFVSWSVLLSFESGSVGNINYVTRCSNALPKERIEINYDNTTITIKNFLETQIHANNKRQLKTKRQDKGQNDYVKMFIKSLTNGQNTLDVEDTFNLTEKLLIENQKLSVKMES